VKIINRFLSTNTTSYLHSQSYCTVC